MPPAAPLLPVALTIGGRPATLLFAGSAPGLVGILQVNAVVPVELPLDFTPPRARLVLTVGGPGSLSDVNIWVK